MSSANDEWVGQADEKLLVIYKIAYILLSNEMDI